MTAIFLYPEFSGEDQGDGGVRRVVEAQKRSLPRLGVTFTEDPTKADLLATHITLPETLAAQFPDKPIVAHCHGLYWSEYDWQNWSYKANKDVLRAVCTADAVTAPAEWVARIIRRHTSRDVRVIPHGVSAKDWQPPSQHKNYVLWNKTRVDPVCDPTDAVSLAYSMPEHDFVFTLEADEPQPSNITLTGRLPFAQAKEVTRYAGVYLCTTRETFGIGTLEAMASGVPVVGYNFGGQEDIITHGVDGWLVEPGDIDGLREGVLWAYENRPAIGEAARLKAQQYSWTEAAKMYRDLYRELILKYDKFNEAPRTSIIITAYNLEQYLPDALKAVAAQDDPDFECLVVDDASPDACGKIADAFAEKDERFRVIHNEQNLYLAESRNVAIAQAKGRYILPLDADDKLTSHTVSTLAAALDDDRALQVAYGNVLFVDEDGFTPTDFGLSGAQPGHSGWPVEKFDPARQAVGENLLPYSSMFRKSAWDLTGGYRRRLKTSEDADFWTRLSSFGFKIGMVTKANTLIYRNRLGSMSRTNYDHRHDYLKWYPWAKQFDLAPAALGGDHTVSLLEKRVAVVIPVGPGHEQRVQDAVDSVMAQSYRAWECIVVNDSGNDLHLPVWVREIKADVRDPALSRNIGIAASTCELFLPLDADDYLQPDALSWLVAAYDSADVQVVYPDFYEDFHTEGVYTVWTLPDWSCDHLLKNGVVHTVTALTERRVWEEVGGYSADLGWEDWDFQLKVAQAGFCTMHLQAPLFAYRKHTGRRAAYSKEEFEERKAQILDRWAPFFQGQERLMGCGCQAKSINPAKKIKGMQNGNGSAAAMQYTESTKVQYTGNKAGAIRFKGSNGIIYSFASGDAPKWVEGSDVRIFASRPDFKIVGQVEASPTGGPVLVAT